MHGRGSTKMHVLVLGSHFAPEPTGNAPYTTRMSSGLLERGHHVEVLTTHPHYPQWTLPDGARWTETELVDGVPVRRLKHYVPSKPVGIRRALAEASYGARAVLSPWHDPDVIICPSPALISTAMALGRVRGGRRKPAIGVVVQDLYSLGMSEATAHPGLAVRALSRLERHTLRHVDGVVAIHDRFKRRMVETLGVSEERITVIRNWTHLDPMPSFDRASFRRALGWSEDEVIVLHAGAMGEKQALSNVVHAAKTAAERHAKVRFVLLGDGGQRPMLEELAGDCTAVEFRDPLPGDEYQKAMGAADVLLVNEKPGVKEMAVPSKLTSYFSTGRPVLAATGDDSITAEEVRSAGAGLVIPAGDPNAMVSAALRMGEDRHSCAELGAQGPVYCETHLSEKVALDAYDEWVRRLAADRR